MISFCRHIARSGSGQIHGNFRRWKIFLENVIVHFLIRWWFTFYKIVLCYQSTENPQKQSNFGLHTTSDNIALIRCPWLFNDIFISEYSILVLLVLVYYLEKKAWYFTVLWNPQKSVIFGKTHFFSPLIASADSCSFFFLSLFLSFYLSAIFPFTCNFM